MTEGIDGDAGGGSILKDRSTLILLCIIAAIVIIGAAYGLATQDERQPAHTMDDIPMMADGSYEYELTVDLGFVTPVSHMTVELSDGEVVSIIMNGSEMPDADAERFVQGLIDTNSVTSVDLGPQWTDGVDTVDTYSVIFIEGSASFAEDGTLLNIVHTGGGYTLTLTLFGWETVQTETTV